MTVRTLSRAGWETPREANKQWLVSTRPWQNQTLSVSALKKLHFTSNVWNCVLHPLNCFSLHSCKVVRAASDTCIQNDLYIAISIHVTFRCNREIGSLQSKGCFVFSDLVHCLEHCLSVCLVVYFSVFFVYLVICLFICLSVCPQDLKDEGWLVYSDLVHCLQHWLHYSWQACVPLAHSAEKVKVFNVKVLTVKVFKGKVKLLLPLFKGKVKV